MCVNEHNYAVYALSVVPDILALRSHLEQYESGRMARTVQMTVKHGKTR